MEVIMLLLIGTILSVIILEPGPNPDGTNTQRGFFFSFAGYGMSAFEDDVIGDMGQGSYVPTGVQLLYGVTPEIRIGVEFEFTGKMFTSSGEYYDENHQGYFEEKNQVYMNAISLIAEYFINDEIFLRGGVARYSGWSQCYDGYYGEWYNVDLESGIGFNFGGGYLMHLSETKYVGLDGIYHIVSLEPEGAGESFGFNHWAARVSIGTGF